MIGGVDTDVVQRWILDPSQYKREIGEVAKLIKKQAKEEKDLLTVREQLDKQTSSISKALSDQVTQLGQTALATMGVAAAVGALKGAMTEVLRQGLEYEDQLKGNVGSLYKMREASSGLSSDLEIQKTRARLLNSDLSVTENQIDAVVKASVAWMRVTGEAKPNLDRTVDAVLAGGRGFKQLGIQAEFAGSNLEKSAQALKTLEERFSGMEPKLENTNEKLTALKNNFDRIIGAVGSWIIGAKGYQDGLDMMLNGAKATANAIQFLIEKLSTFNEASLAGMKGIAALYASVPGFGGVGKTFGAAYVAAGKQQALTGASEEANRKFMSDFNRKAGLPPLPGEDSEDVSATVINLGKKGGAKKQSWAEQVDEDVAKLVLARMFKMQKELEEQQKWAAGDVGKGAAMDARAMADQGLERLERERQERFASSARGVEVDKLSGTFGGGILGDEVAQAAASSAEALEKYRLTVQGLNSDMQSFTTGALGDFVGGMWAAADAAIMGGASFGEAMAKMLKATLLSIAQQSTVKAIFNLAEAAAQWFNPVAVASHLTAAALYGSIALVSGGVGLGMSAAMSSGASKTAQGASASHGQSAGGYKPSFGSTSKEKQTYTINVWLGNKNDPAAALYLRQQVQAMAA